MSYIRIENLTFGYTKNHFAVNDLSLDIKKGEFVCILGHNGSGKSTLAKLLIGLLKARSGNIFIDDEELTEKTVDQIRKKIGIVFQNPDNQFVGVTVQDDIAFGMENHLVPREEMLKRIHTFTKTVSMDSFLNHNPEQLSGGEKQRVAIAGVLAMDPEVIIFDEATSMLDPKGVGEVNQVISDLKGKKTILSITHNLEESLQADRVIVMNEGKILLNGTPREIFDQKKLLKSAHLDILEGMKVLEYMEQYQQFEDKKRIEDLIWEFTFKM